MAAPDILGDLRIARLEIVERLPNILRADHGDAIPAVLVGAKIHRIGTPKDSQLFDGGGLVIDFSPAGDERWFRAVFGLHEVGAWVESIVSLDPPTQA